LPGGHVELLPEDAGAQNLVAALRRAKNRTLVKITPAHLELLGRTFAADEVVCMTRCFVIGGENLRAENLTLWRNFAPATRLINEYGPTETVVGCCVHEVGPDDPPDGSIPIGRPIANTQLYVLGADLEPVPPGAVGELYIGGAGVARGYLNRPELTKERFVPDPFFGGPDARMYKTGDLARYRPDGVLEYLGRVDSQVKIRGHRVELGEIEAALRAHPSIKQAVASVTGTPAELVAHIELAFGAPEPTAAAVQAHLREHLPGHMLPQHLLFVPRLPVSANGKVDRQALPALTARTAPRERVAARTEAERRIVAVWSRIFTGMDIGVTDNFFELGGDSLLLTQLLRELNEAMPFAVDVGQLYRSPTPEMLARLYESGEADTAHEAPVCAPAPAELAPHSAPVELLA
jgi:acyl-coenzyme A synthetase/AMP-(fatty) acid ligase